MVVARFEGCSVTKVRGLTQWDYGQILEIKYVEDIPDGTEIQFYQGILSSVGWIKDKMVQIPDVMLQNAKDIVAYVYIEKEDSGNTILTITMPITARPRPDCYVLPGYENYKRLLPVGGKSGQIPIRTEQGVAWGYAADNIALVDGALQLMAGKVEIGERIRLPTAGSADREIELRNNGNAIQWRYTDSNEWLDLVPLVDLQGPSGITPSFEIREGHLIVKYE